MVQHSKEFALDSHDFEYFVEGANRIQTDYRRLEAVFLAFVAGRLGLRSGEICHIEEDWIDWRRRMIDIPYHQKCAKGKDGGICGQCRNQATQRVNYAEISLAEARLEALQEQLANMPALPGELQRQLQTVHIIHIDSDLTLEALDRQVDELLTNAAAVDDAEEVRNALDDVARRHKSDVELTQEEAEQMMWQAKTENAARSVPFAWCPRAEIAIERFFDRFDSWERSMTAINRRVDETLRNAERLSEEDTMPHGLRATSATHLAGRGMTAPVLQAFFGWSQISTARSYITSSPDNTASQLQQLA